MDRDAHLTAFLAGHEAECPVCGYALAGITQPTCPECAAPLSLAIASPNTGLGPWVTAIVSLAMAIGFDAVAAFMFTIPLIFASGRPPPMAYALWLGLVTLGALCLASMIFLVKRKRSWHHMPRKKQWIFAIGIACVVFVVHAAFGGGWILMAQLI